MTRSRPRIIYLQYTNPAAYPPLEHSSHMLGDKGWDVLFLGAASHGSHHLAFPPHPAIRVRRLRSFGGGVAHKLNYLVYIAWCVVMCLLYRPRWVYASDPLSCPAALAVRFFGRHATLYHEHDTPSYAGPQRRTSGLVQAARKRLAHVAEFSVLPQKKRLEAFVADTGRQGPTLCVWNCPRREEVLSVPVKRNRGDDRIGFYYHGSLNVERIPSTILEAMSRLPHGPELTLVGYETIGSRGFITTFLEKAEALGLGGRVHYQGAMSRTKLHAIAARMDVGLVFMPMESCNINMAHMTGASNKAFDYLAMGQMLLVSDLPEWREMFVEPGYALASNPTDVASLEFAMRWCVENPAAVREKGERGRQRILAEWNYETQFQPVLEHIERDD